MTTGIEGDQLSAPPKALQFLHPFLRRHWQLQPPRFVGAFQAISMLQLKNMSMLSAISPPLRRHQMIIERFLRVFSHSKTFTSQAALRRAPSSQLPKTTALQSSARSRTLAWRWTPYISPMQQFRAMKTRSSVKRLCDGCKVHLPTRCRPKWYKQYD